MKKIITVVIISVFGFSGNLYARIQDSSEKAAPLRIEVFSGKIVSVNPVDSELIVQDKNNEEVTVTIDPDTRISVPGARNQLRKLRAGKNVTIQCRVSGTEVIAQEIR